MGIESKINYEEEIELIFKSSNVLKSITKKFCKKFQINQKS